MRTSAALVTALAIALLGTFLPASAGAAEGPVLTYAKGDVTAKPSGGPWAKAEKGRSLASGDMVKTGARAKAEITFPSGVMRLFENTLVVIPSVADRAGKKDIASVQVDSGSTAYRIDPAVGAGFSVKTKHVIAGVKGTRFGVTADDKQTRVIVYFGQVEVTGPSGGPGVVLGTNQSLTATPAGLGTPSSGNTGDGYNGWSDPAQNTAPAVDPASSGTGGGEPGKDDRSHSHGTSPY